MIGLTRISYIFGEEYTPLFILIIIAIIALQIALILAILKIFTINNKLNSLIQLHDSANDLILQDLSKIEKHLDVLEKINIDKLKN